MQKDWWNSDLTSLKNQSKEIHDPWKLEGKPHSGPIHAECIRVKTSYKQAIKTAQRGCKQALWNKLHDAMAEDDTTNFWNSWRTLYNNSSSQYAPVVNCCSEKQAIAKAFQQSFQANSVPN